MIYKKQTIKGKTARRTRGQGMVEFALSLPLLLLVLAGLMEIANLLLLYARMETVTRESSRFGALGGTETGVREVFFQGARDSLETQPGVIELWVVRPVLDHNGTEYQWENANPDTAPWGVDTDGNPLQPVCVYPSEAECVAGNSGLNPQDILNQIKNSGATRDSADGDRFVIVGTYYEARTILNLPFYKVPGGEAGRVPLRSFAVYRQEVAQETVNMLSGGCTALPIMINMKAVSDEGNMVMDTTPPTGFNVAREGTMFTLTRDPSLAHVDIVTNPNAPGTEFDFLAWRIEHQDAYHLDLSLDFPGNISHGDFGYLDPDRVAARMTPDPELNRGDKVAAQAENVEATDARLDSDIYTGVSATTGGFRRSIRVVLSNGVSQPVAGVGNGIPYFSYEVMDFAVVQIHDYSSATNTLKVEFVRFETSCGESKVSE